MNELDLVTRLHNNDPSAFDDLYRQYNKYVAFICHKFCDNREDAEEAMQDTFLDLYAKVATLRAGTLLALIRRIAVCKCYRKRHKNRQLFAAIQTNVDLTNQEEQNEEFLPAQYLHNKEQREELLNIVMSLPKMQWETVYLYYYAYFGTEEIARLQQCSTSNVRKTLRNARLSIKDKLEGKKKGKALLPTAGFALVSLGAVLVVEEQVFAAAYVYTSAVASSTVAATTTIANASVVTQVGGFAAVKGYVVTACAVALLAVCAATYYVLWPDAPLPTPQPEIPVATTPIPTTTPIISTTPTPPPPTMAPTTTPQPTTLPTTTPQPTPPPTPAPTPAPTTAPQPTDRTQAILAALATASSEADAVRIIDQFGFRYDQVILSNGEAFRFYVTNEGSGDIAVITVLDAYDQFQRMLYAFFANTIMPDNIIELLRLID